MQAARLPTIVAAIPPAQPMKPMAAIAAVPPFVSMPAFPKAQLIDRISSSLPEDLLNEVPKDDNNQVDILTPISWKIYYQKCKQTHLKFQNLLKLPLPGDDATNSVNQMTLLSLHPMTAEVSQSQNQEKRQSVPSSLPSLAPIHGMQTSLKALAEASNITLEALEAAILLRQQQLLQKQQGPSTTTTTTTLAPVKKYGFHTYQLFIIVSFFIQ